MSQKRVNLKSLPLHEVPITKLKTVGPHVSEKLARLNIYNLQDMLLHLPLRYQDKTRLTLIRQLCLGSEAVIEGVIEHMSVEVRKKRQLICHIRDSSDVILLRFFHFGSNHQRSLVIGRKIRCFGEVRVNRSQSSQFEMCHPEFDLLTTTNPKPLNKTLTPVYPSTSGLGQKKLQSLIQQIWQLLGQGTCTLSQCIPNALCNRYSLMNFSDAIWQIHNPPAHRVPTTKSSANLTEDPAFRSLIFEELMAHQLIFQQKKQHKNRLQAIPLKPSKNLKQDFINQLPFELTSAQKRVGSEVETDLESTIPAARLIQGDVGSGKTAIATLAIIQAVENKCQAALIVPTEILAEQHFINISNWLVPLKVNVAMLTGSVRGKERNHIFSNLEYGVIDIVVGTHALLEDTVKFNRFALAIIDEQHRFGVSQRMSIQNKGPKNTTPHYLIMTATPIPRTLAMTCYADLDISIIDELPPGRSPVTTSVVNESKRDYLIQRVYQACLAGKQAYWVCTLIEESEIIQSQAAESISQQLKRMMPKIKIGLIHGRLRAEEKNQIMKSFKSKHTDLLVATTVIEVGVDVPNASLMIIENANRLGLSQLHQLRGRIGRGSQESHCVLLYSNPLSKLAKTRLEIMRKYQDGFKIAEKDLQLRGPGEVLGQRQTGAISFKVTDLERDNEILTITNKLAGTMLKNYTAESNNLINKWFHSKKTFIRV